jgi:hypothetical protein
MRISLKKTKAM